MKFKIPIPASVVLLLFILASCVDNQLPEVVSIGIPTKELNTKIKLNAPIGWNDFKSGNAIALSIINVSDDKLIFDPYYGARIFIYQDDKTWTEVKDQLISLNTDNIILNPIKLDPTATGAKIISPKLDRNVEIIRIFVIGYIYKNEEITKEKTGAFIDIELKP